MSDTAFYIAIPWALVLIFIIMWTIVCINQLAEVVNRNFSSIPSNIYLSVDASINPDAPNKIRLEWMDNDIKAQYITPSEAMVISRVLMAEALYVEKRSKQ